MTDSQRSCKDNTENSHRPLTEFPLMLTSYYYHGMFVKTKKPTLVCHY